METRPYTGLEAIGYAHEATVLSGREKDAATELLTQNSPFCSHHQILCGLAIVRSPLYTPLSGRTLLV
jgi:hypothetical protein